MVKLLFQRSYIFELKIPETYSAQHFLVRERNYLDLQIKKTIQMCIKSYIIFEKVLTFSQQTFILLCYSVGKSLFNKGTYFELVKRKPTTNCIELAECHTKTYLNTNMPTVFKNNIWFLKIIHLGSYPPVISQIICFCLN